MLRESRRARRLSFACFISVIVAALFFAPLIPPSLVVAASGQVVYESVVREAAPTFEVSFRHSVNKGMIREIYRIDKDARRITLETGYFQSYGAGMLDTVEQTDALNFRQEGEYFLLDFPVNWQSNIRYIAGSTAQHVFTYGEDSLPVGVLYPKQPIVISLSRRSFYKWFFKFP